jgi:hypothetical protein
LATNSDGRITIDGSQALVSNVSQHSGPRGSFVVFKDLITDVANRIVKRDGKGATLGSVAGTEIQALHEYVYTDPATGAISIYVLGAIDAGSYIYATVNGGATWTGQTLPITPTAGGKWFFCNMDNRVFAVNGRDAMLVAIQTAPNTLTWRKAGQAAPSFNIAYSLILNGLPYNTGNVSCTQGSAVVNGIGTAWTTGAPWVGKHININGSDYTILTVTGGTVLNLTENFKEPTPAGPTTFAYNIYPGVGDWLTGPRYCIAYRNPTTGHLSNVGPVLEVTEQNQFGRTITVTIPSSAENSAAYNNGYTQIQLFRSAQNAYTLVALNEFLANNAAMAPITYVEDATKFADTYLTDLQAPFDQNGVPPVMTCIAFHQDRAWGLTLDGRLQFTPAPFELDYGVAVEAWPILPQFSRRVQQASGLLVIGGTSVNESLIVQTAKGDRAVQGVDPLTIQVFKLSTRGTGSFLYSAADVAGDLVVFYRDKRLVRASDSADLGLAIQDKLSAVRDLYMNKVRLCWFSAKNRNFLLLSVPSSGASTANDYTYVWDLDKGGLVYEWNAGFSAFATVHDATTGEVQLWAGDSTGAAYHLLSGNNQDAGANFQPVLRTSIIRPIEYDSWSSLVSVEVYVNDASGTWTGRLYIHEQASTGATDGTVSAFTLKPATWRGQASQGKKLIWEPSHSIRTESEALQLELTFPSQNAVLWVEKIVLRFRVTEERTT